MADVAQLVARIRELGANVALDGPRLRVINATKLPAGAAEFIRANSQALISHLEQEADFGERAAIMQCDGGLTRPVAEYLTKLLMSSPPDGVSPADWSWYVGEGAKIVDGSLRRAA